MNGAFIDAKTARLVGGILRRVRSRGAEMSGGGWMFVECWWPRMMDARLKRGGGGRWLQALPTLGAYFCTVW
jgi:hypothetical protein